MAERIAVVFVHGIFSSARTWAAFDDLIRGDADLNNFDRFTFDYWSPMFKFNPLRRVPNYDAIADTLMTFLDTKVADYDTVVLVTHSQGGLIAQRHVARRLANGRSDRLKRIRQIIMFACPNAGAEILLGLRKYATLWRHPQERELRPFSDAVSNARRIINTQVVNATETTSSTIPIPISVYAGNMDNVVPLGPALDVFPDAGALPGDHFTIIQPDSRDHLSYLALRKHLLNHVPARSTRPSTDVAVLTEQWRSRALVDEDALFGIEEPLAELEPWITANDARWVVSIFGRGGAGKTTLAYEAVKRFGARGGFTRIAWVSAKSSRLSLIDGSEQHSTTSSHYWRELLVDLASQLALPVELATARIEDNFAVGLRRLAAHERCLLVVDNLETVVDARNAVTFLEREDAMAPHKVILTTRDSVTGYATRAHQKVWNRLPDEPARELTAHLGRDDSDLDLSGADIDEVVRASEGNPLIIKLIVRLCIDRKQTVPEIVGRIRTEAADRVSGLGPYLFHSSVAALYDRVGEADGAKLLNVFCSAAPGATIGVEDFFRLSGIETRERFDEAKMAAGRLALLTSSHGNTHFAVHSVLRSFICEVAE